MRGTYTAAYLDCLCNAFAKRRGVAALDIGSALDLVAGTSTGGIIACAIAADIPLSDVVDLYRTYGLQIFSRPLPSNLIGTLFDLWKRSSALKTGEKALRKVLTEKFGTTTLGDIYTSRGISLVIPAVEMSQHRAWIFKTPHLKDMTSHRDDNYTLVDVCLATTAAPIYRSMAAVDQPGNSPGHFNVFVDGGLWANNPVLAGLIDALDLAEPEREIQIFCLGTCPMPAGEQIAKSAVNRGLLDWKFGGEAAGLAIDAQQFAYDHMARKLARHISRKCTIIRFPSENVPAWLTPYLQLDDTRRQAMDALISQARSDADMANSRFAYADTDSEAALIRDLFNAAPARTCPPASQTFTAGSMTTK